MTFKKGDLVILVRARNPKCKPYIGLIKTLCERDHDYTSSWSFSPPLYSSDDSEIIWNEIGMRRIDNPGDDAVDEVIQRIGTPHKEVA